MLESSSPEMAVDLDRLSKATAEGYFVFWWLKTKQGHVLPVRYHTRTKNIILLYIGESITNTAQLGSLSYDSSLGMPALQAVDLTPK